MKKLVIAAVAAAALNTVSAQSCASAFSGFYAGLQAGVNAVTGTYNVSQVLGNNGSALKTTPSGQSFLGGLFAGYGMGVGSCAYVGGELYVNFLNNSVTIANPNLGAQGNGTFKANNNFNFGGKIRLGYTVSPQAMVFLGLGIEYTSWRYKATISGVPGAAARTWNGTDSKNKRTTSFAPSVGAELFLSKNIFTRAEYTYVTGQNARFPNMSDPGLGADDKVNLNQHRFVLALGYKF